jgi:hypothetical protein
MAKQSIKKHDDVRTLRDWVEEEIQSRKNDCAVHVLELAQSEEPTRFEQIDGKLASFDDSLKALIKIRDWCVGSE